MRKDLVHLKAWLVIFLSVTICVCANAQTKLLRFPDVYADRIVFTYASDLWTVSKTGGMAKQLTFYPAKGPFTQRWGYDNQVMGWSVDGKSIIFRSQRDSWTLPESQLYAVSINGGAASVLPMPEAGSGDYSPDGKKM